MSKLKPTRELERLRYAIDRRNAQWLENRYPDIDNALRAEMADGATSQDVDEFVSGVAGEQEYFGLKVKSAARHIERQNERRR